MPNPARDSSYKMPGAITGTGSGSVTAISTTATSGTIHVYVKNSNSAAGASGTTVPAFTGNSGAGTIGAFTKIKSQINGFYCIDLWEATWSGGALATCTCTISSMPANTAQWSMDVFMVANAPTGHETVTSQTYSAQNASSPSVTTANTNELVCSYNFFMDGPTAGPAAGSGWTADSVITTSDNDINTYGQSVLEYASQATAGTYTPTWQSEGGGSASGIQITVSLSGASAPTAPAAPAYSGITATGYTITPPTLGSTGATSYALQQSANGSTGWANVAGYANVTTTPPLVFTAQASGTAFYYQWVATNTNGSTTGTPGTVWTFCAQMAQPSLTAGNGQISVSWASITGATSYKIEYELTSAGNAGWNTASGGGAVTGTGPFVITGLSNGTSYDVRISATDASGTGAVSSYDSATPVAPSVSAPTTPTGIMATAAASSISLTMTVDGVTSYLDVYRKRANGAFEILPTMAIGGAGSVTYVDNRVSNGIMYTYYAVARNSGGSSAPTAEVTASTTTGGSTLRRATLYQGFQVAPEVTPGTIIPATRRLLHYQGTLDDIRDTKPQKVWGQKGSTGVPKGKQNTTGKATGVLDFTEILYWLSAHGVSPSAPSAYGSGGYQWTVQPTSRHADTMQTFSMENGGDAGAAKCGYGVVPGITIKCNKDEASVDVELLGQSLVPSTTLTTASVNDVGGPVADPGLVKINWGTSTGSLAQMLSVLDCEIAMTGRWLTSFKVNGSRDFDSPVESAGAFSVKLTCELGSETDQTLTYLAGDTKFYIQLYVQGPAIDGSHNYSFQLTLPVRCEKPEGRQDSNSVFSGQYTLVLADDPTFLYQAIICNMLAAL